MKAWTASLVALLAAAAAAAEQNKIVCYFGSWSVYRPDAGKFDISYIDPSLCSHLIYTFIGLNADGTVRVLDGWQDLPDGKDGFGRFNALRRQSPGTKTMVAMGGWNEGSVKYSKVVANSALRATFVRSVFDFLEKHDFDGFDLDWEYPNQRGGAPADVRNYGLLVKELKEKFRSKGYILSAAVAAAETSASLSYNIPEMSKHLDFINLMAYDLHGKWEKRTGLNAPLYARADETGASLRLNVNASVHYWLRSGAPAEKLILGVPFYGRSFTLADTRDYGVNAPATDGGLAGPYTREAGMLGYNELCEFFATDAWSQYREPAQRAPYAVKGNQWVGYDDVESIAEKAKFAKSLGLGGAMVWSIETDDFRGICGSKYPLLKTLNHVLRNGAPVAPSAPRPIAPPNKPSQRPPVSTSKLCSKVGYVRDKSNCAKFYNCQLVDGDYKVSSFTCSDGLAFDPNIDACNYRNLVAGC